MKNYYQILSIQQTASKDEIKAAYLKLSKKIHPDVNKGDEYFTELFKNVNEAYTLLIDDTKRKNYDFELDFVVSDYAYLKQKEEELQSNESVLLYKQLRRRAFIKGAISIAAGLLIIAMISIFLIGKKEENTLIKSKPIAEVNAMEKSNIIVNNKGLETPPSSTIEPKQILDERKKVTQTINLKRKSKPFKSKKRKRKR